MMWRAVGALSLFALTGCGAAWLGDETVDIAPTSIADAQLVPSVPEETVVVAPDVPSSTATEVQNVAIEAVGPADKGTFAVEPVAVADAALVPTPPTGAVDVAPSAPAGTTGLVPIVAASPAPVPARPAGNSDANLVAFALETSHPVGQSVYPRDAGSVDALACGGYRSPVAAQEAFLRAGGPDRDQLGLDPDGDGYACAWDPSPYREVAGG